LNCFPAGTDPLPTEDRHILPQYADLNLGYSRCIGKFFFGL